MPNNNDKNNLFLYIVLSIIFHFVLLYFLPFGFLNGNVKSESNLNDYGYVQMVEYQPAPLQNKVVEEEAELTEDPVKEEIVESDDKIDQNDQEKSEQEVEQPEKETELDEIVEETENKPVQEQIESAQVDNDKTIEAEKTDQAIDNQSELTEADQHSADNSTPEPAETAEQEELNEKPAIDTQTAENPEPEQEVISSENSESEVEVVQEDQAAQTSEQSNQAQDQAVKEAANNEQQKSADSQVEPVQENEQLAAEDKTETKSKPKPPPLPTSGDLISTIATPTFPKDLVGTRAEGTVELSVQISVQGEVAGIEVLKSSGFDSMDRVAQITLERGWEFKKYQKPYRIAVQVHYFVDDSDNTQVEVEVGQVEFINGGE